MAKASGRHFRSGLCADTDLDNVRDHVVSIFVGIVVTVVIFITFGRSARLPCRTLSYRTKVLYANFENTLKIFVDDVIPTCSTHLRSGLKTG